MLKKNGFTFKQFFVAHDRCAMKVGTDGVLLGAWAPVAGATRILDIGSGSGLIALMLAQRSPETVSVDAVELDSAAAQQARENIARSPWASRIRLINQDITTFGQCGEPRYPLIVSNPPYYSPDVACATAERTAARSTVTLDHATLLHCAAQLITEEGLFCLVLPENVGQQIIALAEATGWHLRLRVDVAEYAQRAPHRVLLGLSRLAGDLQQQSLTIRDEDADYSAAWRHLTGDFYLFM